MSNSEESAGKVVTEKIPKPFTESGKCEDEVTLTFDDGQVLYVSQNFLILVSPVFEAMFRGNFKENQTKNVDLKGKNYDDFLELLISMVGYYVIAHLLNAPTWTIFSSIRRYLVMFVCDQCGKRYKTPGGVRKHVAGHLGTATYTCGECGRLFHCRKDHEQHMLRHGEAKTFVCQTCGKSFKTKNDLDSHRRRESTGQTHECDVCGKRFTSSRDLEEHSRKHSGDFPEICSVCSKRYRHRASLRRHLKTHSN